MKLLEDFSTSTADETKIKCSTRREIEDFPDVEDR